MGRLLDEDDVVDWLLKRTERYDATGHFVDENVVKKNIESRIAKIPSAQPEQRWIPIKWHDCTDEDREKYGFNNDIVVVFDCEMPDDNQSILVTTSHGYINQDVCYIDDGYSLDSGWDWIDDIKAWMPLPEPYKGGEKDG